MAEIKIKDLPLEMKINQQEMRSGIGGRFRDPRVSLGRNRAVRSSWWKWMVGAAVVTAIGIPLDPGGDDDDEP